MTLKNWYKHCYEWHTWRGFNRRFSCFTKAFQCQIDECDNLMQITDGCLLLLVIYDVWHIFAVQIGIAMHLRLEFITKRNHRPITPINHPRRSKKKDCYKSRCHICGTWHFKSYSMLVRLCWIKERAFDACLRLAFRWHDSSHVATYGFHGWWIRNLTSIRATQCEVRRG